MQEEAEHALRRGSHSPRRVDRLCIETGLRRDFNSLGCLEEFVRKFWMPGGVLPRSTVHRSSGARMTVIGTKETLHAPAAFRSAAGGYS